MLAFLLTIADESDRDKVLHIYDKYYIDMMNFAKYYLKKRSDSNIQKNAEDAVQNTFVRIIKFIRLIDFNRENDDIRKYLISIVCHEVLDILNGTDNLCDLDEVKDVACNENDEYFISRLDIKERYQEVVRAIQMLDEKYSLILFEFYCMDQSVKDIADRLGVPPKTVYTRLERGKQMLLERLGNGGAFNE